MVSKEGHAVFWHMKGSMSIYFLEKIATVNSASDR